MISGFLGTLIALERAVAMKQMWMYLPPLFAGLGWLATVLIQNEGPSPTLCGRQHGHLLLICEI